MPLPVRIEVAMAIAAAACGTPNATPTGAAGAVVPVHFAASDGHRCGVGFLDLVDKHSSFEHVCYEPYVDSRLRYLRSARSAGSSSSVAGDGERPAIEEPKVQEEQRPAPAASTTAGLKANEYPTLEEFRAMRPHKLAKDGPEDPFEGGHEALKELYTRYLEEGEHGLVPVPTCPGQDCSLEVNRAIACCTEVGGTFVGWTRDDRDAIPLCRF